MLNEDDLKKDDWDTGSSDEFYDYYAEQSESPAAVDRATRTRDLILRIRKYDKESGPLDVIDVGCNSGTFSLLWAEKGHNVIGVDINARLIELAKVRAQKPGQNLEFRVGSATDLPISNASMDVCIAPELLEHVGDWEKCLDEFTRVLRPGGTLYLTTTNKLCPKQAEFNLPLYSWYPGLLKRHYEKLAITTKPALVNHATYPAVNWFTFYGLRDALRERGMSSMDRFDVSDLSSFSPLKKYIILVIRQVPLLRWIAHVCTPSSVVVATRMNRT